MNTTTTSVRRTRVLAVLTAVIVTVGAAACSEEQRRDLGEVDIRETLADHVEQVVENQELALDGDLDCTADIADDDLAVTSSCTGETSSGLTVSGSFTGSADVEAEECTAALAVTIGDEAVADESGVDCFERVG